MPDNLKVVFMEGKRLYLRPLEESDDRCQVWINDPEVRQFVMNAFPINHAAELEWLKSIGQGNPPSHIVFAIVLNEGDRYIGNIGLHGIDWVNRQTETGTIIGEKDCWDKGYGTEAKQLLIKYAFKTLGLHRLVSTVIANNERSLKCQLKCGYVEEGRTRRSIYKDGEWYDLIILGLLADEWQEPEEKS